MRSLLLSILIWLFAATAGAQRPIRCPQDFLQLDEIAKITAADSVASIDAAFASVLAPDAVTRLVYASHRAKVAPGKKSDRLLLDALPRDEITWHLLYSLTYPDLEGVNEATAMIGGGEWLPQAMHAVVRRRSGAVQFLRQAYLGATNADISEQFEDLYAEFRDRSPALFRSAFSKLHPEEQKYVPREWPHLTSGCTRRGPLPAASPSCTIGASRPARVSARSLGA